MSLNLVTAPAATPISLAEAKAHLRVDHADDDALITAALAGATSHLDGPTGILGRALMSQVWDLYLDAFPVERAIRMPLGPLISVGGAYYIDPDTGVEAEFDSANYEVDTYQPKGWVVLAADASWPATMATINAVRVNFTAGYASAGAVPDPIKSAIKLMVGDLYANRETAVTGISATALPSYTTVKNLIMPLKLSWF